MTFKKAIDDLLELEGKAKQLRAEGFQAGWFVCAMRGIEKHISGVRFAIEGIEKMTRKMTKKP